MIKIALAAARHINRNISYNLTQLERFMRRASQAGAQLVCFGEAFLQGFDCLDWVYEADRHTAISVRKKTFARICRLSAEIGVDVLFGFIEHEGNTLYSSAALIEGGALRQLYRRISRGWKEYTRTDAHYREGEIVPVFEYRGRTFSIALCGDLWEAPERFALGEDILLWPVYICYTPEEWNSGADLEYAAQANLSCARTLMINSICDGDAHGGAFCFENGAISAELKMDKEGLLIVEI